jgi:ferredoxin-type protein NapH
MKYSKKRGIVALIVFLSVVVGLVVHTGTGTVSAIGFRDIALICPVGALEVLAGAKALLVHPIVLLVVALVVAFVFGKAFCSWVCPVPHVRDFFHPQKKAASQDEGRAEGEEKPQAQELLQARAEQQPPTLQAQASAKVQTSEQAQPQEQDRAASQDAVVASGKALPPVGGKRDGQHLDSRHFVLIGAIASSFAFGFPVFCLICPVGLSFAITIGVWNLFRFNEVSWGLIVFPVILILEIAVFRKWCTTFCPISALISLVSTKTPFWRPRVNRSACLREKGVDCRTCATVCPEEVDPHSEVIPECSRCGLCVEQCPAHAISLRLMKQASDLDGNGTNGVGTPEKALAADAAAHETVLSDTPAK